MNLSVVDIVNLISSLASLILSVIAISLSLYFYTQSKDTEKEVNESLAEIKTHAGALERLTSKWMDRFTRFVTSPQPMDALEERLIKIIETSSSIQGNKETGIKKSNEEEPLMYKEENEPQTVVKKTIKPNKKKSKKQ